MNKQEYEQAINKEIDKLFEGIDIPYESLMWQFREKLYKIVNRWKSKEYRQRALYREAQFYIGLYYSLPNGVAKDETKFKINTCQKLVEYLDENS